MFVIIEQHNIILICFCAGSEMKCIVLSVLMIILSMVKVYSVGNCVYIATHRFAFGQHSNCIKSIDLHIAQCMEKSHILFLFKVIYSHLRITHICLISHEFIHALYIMAFSYWHTDKHVVSVSAWDCVHLRGFCVVFHLLYYLTL